MEKETPMQKYAKINHEEKIKCIEKANMKGPYVQRPGPYKVYLEANKRYGWCTCGLSKKDPFCDGSHKGICE